MIQKAQILIFLLIWRKVLVKKKYKNDRIEEVNFEGETIDSVSTTVKKE